MTKKWQEHSRVKCDCGHYPKDHFAREGWCEKCGCTWYYPNYKYILRKQKKERRDGNRRGCNGTGSHS